MKGKYAARAQRRRAASLQRQKEALQLRTATEEQLSAAADTKRLETLQILHAIKTMWDHVRTQADQASPQLRSEIETLTLDIIAITLQTHHARNRAGRIINRSIAGLTGHVRNRAALKLLEATLQTKNNAPVLITTGVYRTPNLTAQQIERIQRARGLR